MNVDESFNGRPRRERDHEDLLALRALLLRLLESSSALRSRMAVGVTSMSSSDCTYPMASSREMTRGGVSLTVSSFPLAHIRVIH